MKITYLNFEDLVGRRFNGYDLARYYNRLGHACCQLVWYKTDDTPFTRRIWDAPGRVRLYSWIRRLEARLGILGLLYPFSVSLRREFRECDLLHVHLIAHFYFNLLELMLLSALKPTVMTIHDLSFLSGRCVHPEDGCEGWLTGCRQCPDIPSIFPVKTERTAMLWSIKRFVYEHSDFDIVVSSKWLLDRVERSPMFRRCEKHQVPFGLDLDIFRPLDKSECKRALGIPPEKKVVMFRAVDSPFKGLGYILEALRGLPARDDLCILTLNDQGHMAEFKNKFQVIELGLFTSEEAIARVFGASDVFLMPSLNETFGMMAMEAMACGVPSVVTEDTPLPDVAFAPEASIAVPRRDPQALRLAMEALLNDATRRKAMGCRARQLAEEHYCFKRHAKAMKDIYEHVIAKRSIKRK